MGKSSGRSSAQSSNEPWEEQAPYLKALFQAGLAGTKGQFRNTSSPFTRWKTMGVPLGTQDWQSYVANNGMNNSMAPNNSGQGILAQIADAEQQRDDLTQYLRQNHFTPNTNAYQDKLAEYKNLTGEDYEYVSPAATMRGRSGGR